MSSVDRGSEDQVSVDTGSKDMTLDCEEDISTSSTQFCGGAGPVSLNSSSSSSSSSLTSTGAEDSGMDMACACEGDTEHEVGWAECVGQYNIFTQCIRALVL